MHPLRSYTAVMAFAACAAAPVQSQTVYSNNFDAPVVVTSGVTANFNAGAGALDATIAPYAVSYGNIFRSDSNTVATELTLSNLPTHSTVDIGFTLAFLDSWDSVDGSPAPDYVDLLIDGNKVASYTYNNASGSAKLIGGGTLVAEYVQFDTNIFYSDTVVDMSGDPGLVFAHSAATLRIGFIASGNGWQGGNDEAWGIDNLTVSVAGVPEPASAALMLSGLVLAAGMAARHRRR